MIFRIQTLSVAALPNQSDRIFLNLNYISERIGQAELEDSSEEAQRKSTVSW